MNAEIFSASSRIVPREAIRWRECDASAALRLALRAASRRACCDQGITAHPCAARFRRGARIPATAPAHALRERPKTIATVRQSRAADRGPGQRKNGRHARSCGAGLGIRRKIKKVVWRDRATAGLEDSNGDVAGWAPSATLQEPYKFGSHGDSSRKIDSLDVVSLKIRFQPHGADYNILLISPSSLKQRNVAGIRALPVF